MLLAAPLLARRRTAPEAAALVVVALLVLAAAVDLLPAVAAVALAASMAATFAVVRLSRLAVRPATRAAVVLLDGAILAAGSTAAVLPLARGRAVVVAGTAVVGALAVLGLRRLPGRSGSPLRARLRRLTEATGPAVGLALTGWLLLTRPAVPAPARLAVAVLLGVVGSVGITALTGAHHRPGAATCRGGVALTLLGLVLLAVVGPGPAVLVAVPPLVTGLLLVAAGAVPPTSPGRAAPVWPRAVVPALAVLLAAGWHVGAGLPTDRATVLLGVLAVPALLLRELVRPAPGELPSGDPGPASGPPSPPRTPAGPSTTSDPVPDGAVGAPAPPPGPVPAGAVGVPEPLPAGAVGAPGPLPADVTALPPPGASDRPALLRAVATAPAGALLVVELHVPGAEAVPPALRDDLLAEAVHRARAVVGRSDLLAATGAAGFAVLTPTGPVLAYALGERLLAALTQPYRTGGTVLRVQASVGLAEITGAGPEDVLRQADLARRRAVQLGRDRVEWYDAFLEEQLVRRLDLERELPGAVARGELDLVYQPVLGLVDRLPVGTEALLRWRSPVLGTVLPAELLPVAEDLDVVGELEWWALDRACRQLAEWSAHGRQLWMAVNVTTGELTIPDFVQRTGAILAAYGVPPDRLVVEVAEPRIGADLSTVVARLAGLRSLGVRTALDDFRAEHASLAHLRRLPIDLLKVNGRLVDSATETQDALIDVVVSVGDRLGVEVVAEDLESPAQVEGARRAGCRYGQGFALARPATAERVEAYFEEFPSTPR
ncbi:EAL domain-containing protein [Micromonospora globbae]|uniref:EAL domain-containing protein n=1 Tax=Micromonospora globbae TaxID=1894969 RepID=UPI00386983B1|nr:EAL domain-containing protein [Micromonospora globbae]